MDEKTDVVVTMTNSQRSPWFNMVKKNKNDFLSLLVDGDFKRRQEVPLGFDMTTVAYVVRPSFILNNQRIWDGQVRGLNIPRERAIDIDTPLDLEITRFIHEKCINKIDEILKDKKTVLITGATGRLGSEFAKSIVKMGIKFF